MPRLALVVFAAAASRCVNAGQNSDDLRPVYHFTRKSGDMNGPNGLMWTAGPDTPGGFPTATYHMYFQSEGPGSEPTPTSHAWGHARSTDLVHWTRGNRTQINGSSGGGVALPEGFRSADGGAWRAVALAKQAVGLSVWYSEDTTLERWAVVNGSGSGICPGMVPDNVHAGYIGDNYAWYEPNYAVSTDNGTYLPVAALAHAVLASACGRKCFT